MCILIKSDDIFRTVDRNMEARNLLSNMLGFTRHERLDVKKPGPPAEPPPSSQSPHETPKLPESNDKKEDINKEVLPTHIKGWYLFCSLIGAVGELSFLYR